MTATSQAPVKGQTALTLKRQTAVTCKKLSGSCQLLSQDVERDKEASIHMLSGLFTFPKGEGGEGKKLIKFQAGIKLVLVKG